MEDAYTIGIRLLLEDSVSVGLASIQAELASVDQAIAGTTGRLTVLRAAAVRPVSPETPVLPAAAARSPYSEIAATEPSALPASSPVPDAAALAAPAPLPPPLTVQHVAFQAPVGLATPGPILPVARPASPLALSVAPVHPVTSLQPVVHKAETHPAVDEVHDPAIFAPRLPAPMLLPLLPRLSELAGRDPERSVVIAAKTDSVAGTPLPSDGREIFPVAAPVRASVDAIAAAVPAVSVLAAPVQPAASPAFQVPPIAAAQIAPAAISRAAAAPVAPMVVPAVLPAAQENDRPAFAPLAGVPLIVPVASAVAPAVNTASMTIPPRPPTVPSDPGRQAATERQQDGTREMVSGDIYLDGARLGRWVRDHLAREVSRPQAGTIAFDPTLSPSWPGALQGS